MCSKTHGPAAALLPVISGAVWPAGVGVWVLYIVATWFHAQFIQPAGAWFQTTILGSWEESIKSFVHEAFAQLLRFVNGCVTWSTKWVPGVESLRPAKDRTEAWQVGTHASFVLSTCSHPAAVTCAMDRCRHLPAPVACGTSDCVQLTDSGARLQTWAPGPNNFNLMIARDRSVHGHSEDGAGVGSAGQEPPSPRGGTSAWSAGAVPDRPSGAGQL